MSGQMISEDEFWGSAPRRAKILQYARATRTGQYAVLGYCLARTAAIVPPNVVITAYTGGKPASLNFYAAILGASGDGKGLAGGAADNLMPDLLGATETLPVSGEGLATIYAAREPLDDDGQDGDTRGRTRLVCVGQRAMLDVPEVGNLSAAMGRLGSTLLSTLLSVWSGEPMGGQNREEAKRLYVPAYGYRLALVTGVQIENIGKLTCHAADGLPQRFLWVDPYDSQAPERPPAKPEGDAGEWFGFDPAKLKALEPNLDLLSRLYRAGRRDKLTKYENGTNPYRLIHVRYPDEVREEIERDALRRLQRTRPNGMDAHALLLTLKTAALLAILEQRNGQELLVRSEDWQAARYLVHRSQQTREKAMHEATTAQRNSKAESIANDTLAREAAADLAQQANEQQAEEGKQRLLAILKQSDHPIPRRDLVQKDRVIRKHLDKIASQLKQEGRIAITQGERGGSLYSLPTT